MSASAYVVYGSPALDTSVDRILQDFDWAITSGGFDVAFGNGGEEIVGNYTVPVGKETLLALTVQKQVNGACESFATAENVYVTAGAPTSSEDGLVDVTMTLNTNSLNANSVVAEYDVTSNELQIYFCLRADLLYSGDTAVSVNFHETMFNITVDMTSGFEVTAMTARDAALSETKEASLNYNITAHQMNPTTDLSNSSTWEIGTNTLNNGDALYVLVVANNAPDGVEMKEVLNFNFTAGTVSNNLKEYVGGALFQEQCGTTTDDKPACAFKALLASEYFDSLVAGVSEPGAGVGNVLLGFSGARRLGARALQADSDITQFGLEVDLNAPFAAPEEESAGVVSTTSFMAVMIASALFFM